jgi:hypothetical protein
MRHVCGRYPMRWAAEVVFEASSEATARRLPLLPGGMAPRRTVPTGNLSTPEGNPETGLGKSPVADTLATPWIRCRIEDFLHPS